MLCEAYSAELWRRWWANDVTGEVFPVVGYGNHDDYLFDHLEYFFDAAELTKLPDPTDPYDVDGEAYSTDPDAEIQSAADEFLVAAYDKGWHAVLYDGNNHQLSLRTSGRNGNLRGIRKIVRTIMNDTPVTAMILEVNDHAYQMDADALVRFLKSGRLPVHEAKTLELPTIEVGDTVMVGKWKNRKAEIKDFTTDQHNQPVLKTNKGDQKLFKPRIAKLMDAKNLRHWLALCETQFSATE